MSFLVRAVLGERVVHPRGKVSTDGDDAARDRDADAKAAPNGQRNNGSPSPAAVLDGKAGERAGDRLGARGADGSPIVVQHDFATMLQQSQQKNQQDDRRGEEGRHDKENPSNRLSPSPSLLDREQRNGASSSKGVGSSRSADARTLLMRVQTCTIAQDLRDALADIEQCRDLAYVMGSREVAPFIQLLRDHDDDERVTLSVLRILTDLTDVSAYPSDGDGGGEGPDGARGKGRGKNTYAVTAKEKRQIRNSFVHELVQHVPLLLELMISHRAAAMADPADGESPPALEIRLRAVQLLQRLEEYNPASVHKLLLSSHGIGTLVDLLAASTDHGAGSPHTSPQTSGMTMHGRLQREGLALVTALTAADADLQTLIAFENGFESLFELARDNGGLVEGGVIVSECLTTIHNMLRGNKSTQKFFLEMGCARYLSSMLSEVPQKLAKSFPASSSAARAQSEKSGKQFGGRESTAAYVPLTNMQSIIALSTVSIAACLLREADEPASSGADPNPNSTHIAGGNTPEDGSAAGAAVRASLMQCGLLPSLAGLALAGVAVDDGVRIESLRVLALLLRRCKSGVRELLSGSGADSADAWQGARAGSKEDAQQLQVTTLLRADAPARAASWDCTRALLEYLLTSDDRTLLSATAQVLTALLDCASRGADGAVAVTRALLRDFAPVALDSNDATGRSRSGQTVSAPGAALGVALMSPTPFPQGKYYAARLLAQLLPLTDTADRLMDATMWAAPGGADAGVAGTAAAAAAAVGSTARNAFSPPTSPLLGATALSAVMVPGVTLSAALPPSFFNAFVSYTLFCVSGGHASQRMDTAALGAYAFVLLRWLRLCPQGVERMLADAQWYPRLLQLAAKEGQVNVRLWSAAIAAVLCTHAPREETHAHCVFHRRATMEMFINQLGGSVALENLVFDVSASTPQWSEPVPSTFAVVGGGTAVYDAAFVQLLQQVIRDFKAICPSLSSAAVPVARALPPSAPESDGLHHSQRDQELGQGGASEPLRGSRGASPAWQPGQTPQDAVLEQRRRDEQWHDLQEQVHSQSAALAALQEENTHLRAALDSAAQAAAQTRVTEAAIAPQEASHDAASAAEAVERTSEDEESRHVQWVREIEVQHEAALSDLRENVRLLEEALSAKEEQQQQLSHTLGLMEMQLQQQQQQQQQQLRRHQEQHEYQMQQLRQQAADAAAAATAAAAPPPLPAPIPHSSHVAVAVSTAATQTSPLLPAVTEAPAAVPLSSELPRASNQELAAQEARERELRDAIARATADRDDLLLMVGELDEDRATVGMTANGFLGGPPPEREIFPPQVEPAATGNYWPQSHQHVQPVAAGSSTGALGQPYWADPVAQEPAAAGSGTLAQTWESQDEPYQVPPYASPPSAYVDADTGAPAEVPQEEGPRGGDFTSAAAPATGAVDAQTFPLSPTDFAGHHARPVAAWSGTVGQSELHVPLSSHHEASAAGSYPHDAQPQQFPPHSLNAFVPQHSDPSLPTAVEHSMSSLRDVAAAEQTAADAPRLPLAPFGEGTPADERDPFSALPHPHPTQPPADRYVPANPLSITDEDFFNSQHDIGRSGSEDVAASLFSALVTGAARPHNPFAASRSGSQSTRAVAPSAPTHAATATAGGAARSDESEGAGRLAHSTVETVEVDGDDVNAHQVEPRAEAYTLATGQEAHAPDQATDDANSAASAPLPQPAPNEAGPNAQQAVDTSLPPAEDDALPAAGTGWPVPTAVTPPDPFVALAIGSLGAAHEPPDVSESLARLDAPSVEVAHPTPEENAYVGAAEAAPAASVDDVHEDGDEYVEHRPVPDLGENPFRVKPLGAPDGAVRAQAELPAAGVDSARVGGAAAAGDGEGHRRETAQPTARVEAPPATADAGRSLSSRSHATDHSMHFAFQEEAAAAAAAAAGTAQQHALRNPFAQAADDDFFSHPSEHGAPHIDLR